MGYFLALPFSWRFDTLRLDVVEGEAMLQIGEYEVEIDLLRHRVTVRRCDGGPVEEYPFDLFMEVVKRLDDPNFQEPLGFAQAAD